MDSPIRFGLSTFLLPTLLFLSCQSNPAENSGQLETTSTYDLAVNAIQYDEFQRVVPFQGTASLTLVTVDRVLRGTIADGDTSFTFSGVPLQQFILRAEKEGFYPYENAVFTSTAKFYPLPSPDMRIDTIQITGERVSTFDDEIRIRSVGHQEIPSDGVMYCTFLFGLDSSVSQKPGTYFSSSSGIGGNSNVFLGSFEKSSYRFATGTTIYVTARLYTGATQSYYDNVSKVEIFSNLEENSKVITSFTY